MRKIIIKVPATSANLGVGFDCLGLALNLYNKYQFEEASDFILEGFEEEYSKDNLVLSSYKRLFSEIDKDPIKVKITQLENNIPCCRGLGSSASCIVAGVIGANFMLGNIYNIDELIDFASMIEGHPDNVLPCFLGGLTSGLSDMGEIIYTKYDVSNKLFFKLLIPNFSLATSVARGALPSEVCFKEAMDNLAKAVSLPLLLSQGDFKALKVATRGGIHEKYRYPLIDGAEKLVYEITDEDNIVLISGAGPTLLVISQNDNDIELNNKDWKVVKVKIDKRGVEIK